MLGSHSNSRPTIANRNLNVNVIFDRPRLAPNTNHFAVVFFEAIPPEHFSMPNAPANASRACRSSPAWPPGKSITSPARFRKSSEKSKDAGATYQALAAFHLDLSLFWRRKLLHSRFSPPQREEPMATSETKKCAHPVCACQVTSEKYCSTQCEAMEEVPDVDCKCPHSICAGRTEYAAHA